MSKRRQISLLFSALAVIFIAGTIWFALSESNQPHYQQRVNLPGMAGEGENLVNLWLDPDPPSAGTLDLTIQILSLVGTPNPVNSVNVNLTGPDGSVTTIPTEYHESDDGREHVYLTSSEIRGPGNWQIAVLVGSGGRQSTAVFSFDVQE